MLLFVIVAMSKLACIEDQNLHWKQINKLNQLIYDHENDTKSSPYKPLTHHKTAGMKKFYPHKNMLWPKRFML